MKDFDKYKTKGAYHYDWYKTEPWYKACVDECVEFCKGSTIDAGCGDGLVASKLMFEKHEFVLGVDNDDTGLNLCIGRGIPTLKGDLNKRFSVGMKFDYLCSLNTIEHLNNADGLKYLITNFVTKGAIIITDIPQEHPSKYHVKEYSPKELADLFSEWEVVSFRIDENFHGIKVYK